MIKIRELYNGVKVVMEEIPYVQSVAVGIWVKTGAVDEPAEYSGISHFVEHMMFKGTNKRNAEQIANEVDSIGGHINAFTGREATCYYIKTLASNLDKSMEILIDMFTDSIFDKKEMSRERGVICEEIKMIRDTPDEYVNDSICELVFKGNRFGKSIVGTPSSLKRISRDVIVDYVHNEYTKDSIVISVAGNFDEEHICSIFERGMSSRKASKEGKEQAPWEYVPRFSVKKKDIEQTHICLATRSMDADDDMYPAMMLLSNVMGGTMSSRLFQNVRERKGLAYSVYSMNSSFSTDGYFNIYAGIAHDKVNDAINAIKEELDILESKGITEEELSKAKEQLKSSFIFSQENVNSRMFSMGNSMIILGKVRTAKETVERIDGVTMKDISKVADIITDMDRYSGVAVSKNEIKLKEMIKER